MRVGKVSLVLLGFTFALNASAVGAQGFAEYGAASAASASLTGAAAKGQGTMGGAMGGAFGSVVNSLNAASGGSSAVAASHRTAAPVLNGMNKDGTYDPNLAAKQAVTYSNKLFVLGQQKEKAGMLKEAEQYYRQSLGYRENIWGTSDPNVVKLYSMIASLALKRHDLSEAERCYRVVLLSIIAAYGQGSYEEIPILAKLGKIYSDEKKYTDAIKEYEQIYKLEDRKNGAQDPKTIAAAINLAKTNLQTPETTSDAAQLMKAYVDAMDKGSDNTNPQLVTVMDVYVTALRKLDKGDLADKVQSRADDLRKTLAVGKPAADDAAATASGAGKATDNKAADTFDSKAADSKSADSKAAATPGKDDAGKAAPGKDSATKDAKDSGAKDASAKGSASAL